MMNFKQIENLNDYTGTVIIPFSEDPENRIYPLAIEGLTFSSTIFSGKKDTQHIIQIDKTIYILVGIGKELSYKDIKNTFRRVASKQKDLLKSRVAVVIPNEYTKDDIEATFGGLFLGTYNLGHFKKSEPHPFLFDDFALEYIASSSVDVFAEKGIKIAHAQLETFHLVDLPPNVINPKYLADWAKETGKTFGFEVNVFNKAKATEVGLHSFLSVGRGSAQEPQFIIIEYTPKDAKKHIGLVGKGITFDTGGLNIKTAGMVQMKCDMAGAAAVLGTMQLIADLKLPYQITAIVPACENSVDANSFLPSDVIQSYSGKSIEIIDTDAEGRLILADGLTYLIKNYNPDTVIDMATLTGSAVGTFGYECAALFSNDKKLAHRIQEIGENIGEKTWELPLWDCYKSDIDSEIADVKNYSGKPMAGAITAAKFLEAFTENHPSWAHLDIAGVAFGDDEFAKTKHATAYGVHLLTNVIQSL
ncbi:leucyl aminopeptidase family protein [Flavobacterium capsici]|uniref:Leucyl aminopeptidase family protein n=1 Tax=Flavobacterium capsici TaxID=3075618 RepID=A0AA96J1R2_9FLAO|nr:MULTISPECIES: leucyl aminopeptidase family protein [unclassified Flavobacterium]WNM18165.1 leucyl aminopeptidase family protein [Flavobacterium sp. PMR2A8]WNM22217.1 leucyl aminopeptidase family protein [Flavobacterium sp. PMTSA4]